MSTTTPTPGLTGSETYEYHMFQMRFIDRILEDIVKQEILWCENTGVDIRYCNKEDLFDKVLNLLKGKISQKYFKGLVFGRSEGVDCVNRRIQEAISLRNNETSISLTKDQAASPEQTVTLKQKTSHEMARELLALPDVPLGIEGWYDKKNYEMVAEIANCSGSEVMIWQKPIKLHKP